MLSKLSLLLIAVAAVGCARPNEVGWTPAYTAHERDNLVLRTWDWEGKQTVDDWDTFWLQRPPGQLTIWNLR